MEPLSSPPSSNTGQQRGFGGQRGGFGGQRGNFGFGGQQGGFGGMGGFNPMMGGYGGGFGGMGGFNPMMGGYGGGFSGFNPMMGGFGGFNPMMGGFGGFNPMMMGLGGMGGYGVFGGGFNPMMGDRFGFGRQQGGFGGRISDDMPQPPPSVNTTDYRKLYGEPQAAMQQTGTTGGSGSLGSMLSSTTPTTSLNSAKKPYDYANETDQQRNERISALIGMPSRNLPRMNDAYSDMSGGLGGFRSQFPQYQYLNPQGGGYNVYGPGGLFND